MYKFIQDNEINNRREKEHSRTYIAPLQLRKLAVRGSVTQITKSGQHFSTIKLCCMCT